MASHRPLLIYDGDCRFCSKWVARLRTFLRDRIDCQAFQECGHRFPQLTPEQFNRSIHLVHEDGTYRSAAHAFFTALALRWEAKPLLWLYQHLPFFAPLSETLYSWVATHRVGISRLDRLSTGLSHSIPNYSISSWLFLRGLALVLVIAFISLGVQAQGLIGENGISPLRLFLSQFFQYHGLSSFYQLPTIFWLGDSDFMLLTVITLGTLVSLLALIGYGGATAFLLAWFLYLSLVCVGEPFLNFQWDGLLLEVTFLAVLLSPWQLNRWPSKNFQPSFLARWLILLLLFRLMFFSGVVKLSSGDPTWANLTALTYHYETQPLPTLLAYYAHQLPTWFHQLSALLMFIIELGLAFFIFGPRRFQLSAAAGLLFLQLLIFLTGNYCFFNLLSALLCLLLIDNATWLKLWKKKKPLDSSTHHPTSTDSIVRLPSWSLLPVLGLVLVSTLLQFSKTFPLNIPGTTWFYHCYQTILPFRSINHYGLFSIMTTTRPEIVLEGSYDGSTWLEYRFKWKPGHVQQAPLWVAPHQPRLDWQMWFAALGTYQKNPWLIHLAERLLQGSPTVLSLLENNPFPQHPPRFIRATIYQYQFTTPQERKLSGQWWTAQFQGLYLPPISLRQ
jgi:lipase maturation factor 1